MVGAEPTQENYINLMAELENNPLVPEIDKPGAKGKGKEGSTSAAEGSASWLELALPAECDS